MHVLSMEEDNVQHNKISVPCSLDDIPAELLAKIFSHLPVYVVLRIRCVCKSWNSIISHSSTFPSLWSKRCPQVPSWIIMYSSQDSFAAFDPSTSFWFTLPIPSLKCPYQKRILSSCGGLVCISCDSCRSLFVCNPITRECRTLPKLPILGDNFHGEMMMHEGGSSYSIYVAKSIISKEALREGGHQAALYSSVDDSWYPLNAGTLPLIEGCQGDNAVLHAKSFFSLSKMGPPHQITVYDPMKQDVTIIRLPFERSMSLFPPLCVRHGRLFLAGGVWEYLPFSTFNIWELDHFTNKFVQLDHASCAALDDSSIPPLPIGTLERFGSGDILCFHTRVFVCPVVYDMKEKFWMCMPRYYGPCRTRVPSIIFEPSFSAKV